eukprot:TRINITY_DN9537_c0_g1_i1.p1 TRINITY_DN9537_c0_g1~~TRINITY_DN9537_c0_g1_i1.p1  ORF type:complete len:273 (+),score=29.27 TRINITY_DN9537_c0_g1_i1:32-850(+)
MGLCKCRNITDLFCFVHKKAVCESCICPDHKVCIIGTYVQWLQDPDYEQPYCEICKDEITPDNVIRLLCFHMLHPECLDLHASSFPANTAQAGFTCPTCTTPIVPTRPGNSDLSQILLKHLEQASWLDPHSLPKNEILDLEGGPTGASHPVFVKDSIKSSVPKIANSSHIIDLPDTGIASRKLQRAGTFPAVTTEISSGSPVFDDDEDKYNKHSLARLLSTPKEAPLLPTQVSNKKLREPRGAVRFTTRRLLIVFALLSTLAIVAILSLSLE